MQTQSATWAVASRGLFYKLRNGGKNGLRLLGLLRVKIQIGGLKKVAGRQIRNGRGGTEQEKAGEKEKIAGNCQPEVNYCQSKKIRQRLRLHALRKLRGFAVRLCLNTRF
jgi:hypothetical protein